MKREWDYWKEEVREELESGTPHESQESDWTPRATGHYQNRSGNALPLPAEPPQITWYKKVWLMVQKIALIAGLLAVVFLPFITKAAYRVSILSFVMGLLIRLFIVFQDSANKKLEELKNQLSTLASASTQKGLLLPDFAACQPLIEQVCTKILGSGQNLLIEGRVVAGVFSGPFFRDRLLDWSRNYPQQTITFHLAIVRPSYLTSWGEEYWSGQAESTSALLGALDVKPYCTNLKIRLFEYDSLMDSHGVLINSQVLFKGRTEWVHGKKNACELKVGTRPYRRFTADDPEGIDNISTFHSWMKRIRLRDAELNGSQLVADKQGSTSPVRSPTPTKAPVRPFSPQGIYP